MTEYLDPLLVTVTPSPLPVSATLTPSQVANSTSTTISASLSSITLLTNNTSRQMATIFNDSNTDLYVKLGAVASSSSFTVRIPKNGYYEFPLPIYTGVVDGVWDLLTGSAKITEFF